VKPLPAWRLIGASDSLVTLISLHVRQYRAVRVDDNGKQECRRRVLAVRRAVPTAVREAERTALATALMTALTTTLLPLEISGMVCAYWPVGSEPGSPELLDCLRHRGYRVLLPVVGAPSGTPEPLDWAEYTGAGSLRTSPLGLLEPAGPRLGCTTIAAAILVLVPALAVDRRGVRLGRGGGHYDRSLPLAIPGTPLVAVVRDDEVRDALPMQPHDVRVTAALTPGQGLIQLPY
jgi:5-formyltetrahydrofolate cyclo-ligase